MTLKRMTVLFLLAALLVATVGCGTSRTTRGAVIGAAAGGAAGAAIGHAAGNTAVGAIMGAVIGGSAGAYIGDYMDRQAEEMEATLDNADIERVGEGIKVTFRSGILFEVDRAELQFAATQDLKQLAEVLNKYDDTEILIEGHTDATGPDEYNLELSRRRADAVAIYLDGLGVDGNRFTVHGYGEAQPVASNDTAEGRQLNRRVNLAIMANDDLKEAAERRTGGS